MGPFKNWLFLFIPEAMFSDVAIPWHASAVFQDQTYFGLTVDSKPLELENKAS